MTRRHLPVLLAIALAPLLAGCGKQAAVPELHLFIWADYVKPELVRKFEEKAGCRVVLDTFDSNESMYAKLRAGASGYDIAMPSSYMVKLMDEQGMVARLDAAKLPGLRNIDPGILGKVYDKEMRHSVPYAIGCTVMAFRKDRVKEPKPSWAMFEHEDLKSRTTLLDDMRETLGAALKHQGESINTRDEAKLAAAAALATRWKKNSAKFENEQYKGGIDSGEFDLVMGYSGDLFQVLSENDKVGILVPEEGVAMACDEFVILKDAPQSALAHQFIEFMLDPANAAENMQWMGYLMPNAPAQKLVPKEFLDHPAIKIPDTILAKSEIIEDMGADLEKFSKAWDTVKAAP
jgi:spermidine/putrescine transport system substrate-binding protein